MLPFMRPWIHEKPTDHTVGFFVVALCFPFLGMYPVHGTPDFYRVIYSVSCRAEYLPWRVNLLLTVCTSFQLIQLYHRETEFAAC